jgi:hypothetical protein
VAEKPRIFYRGTYPYGTRDRIRTGDVTWDGCLFVSSRREAALTYGPDITVYEALPEARILYEGTREFRSVARGLFKPGTKMLPSLSETVRRASVAGYSAVWFTRQEDFGTAIFRPESFCIHPPMPAVDVAVPDEELDRSQSP